MTRLLSVAFLLVVAAHAEDPRLVIESGGHTATIKSVMFNRDGKYLVSAGDDKTVRVWDVTTGRVARVLRGQIGDGSEGKIYAVALSPDNRYLAVGGWLAANTGTIRIHDFQSGRVLALLTGHGNVIESLAFSPDNRHLASGSFDNTVRVGDVETKTSRQLKPAFEGAVYAVAFSPDGKLLVAGSDDRTLGLWETATGRLVRSMTGHQAEVKSVLFSPDGQYIVSGGYDKSIRLWNGRTGEFIREFAKAETQIQGLSFSPDGTRLLAGAVSHPYTCTAYDFPTGKPVTRFTKHDNIVLATAISPDARTAATGGGDRNAILLWDIASGKVQRELRGAGQPVRSVAFAKDGQSIAFGNISNYNGPNDRGPLEQSLLLHASGELPVSLGGPPPSGVNFIRALDRVGNLQFQTKPGKVWPRAILEITKGQAAIHSIERDSTSGQWHTCYSFTPEGKYFASGGAYGFLTLYSTDSGKILAQLVGHTSDVWAVAVSLDGRTLVSGSDDQTVRLWDIPSGRNLLSVFVGEDQEWVAWTPEGYYTSSVNGDKYIGWQLNRGVDQPAEFYSATQFQKQFYRPALIAEYLRTHDIRAALKSVPERPNEALAGPASVAASLPPMISISAPEQDSTVREPELTVKAEALSNTLPITDVKILLNGVQANNSSGLSKGDPRRRRVEAVVQLAEGQNVISVIAANEKAMSDPETRRVRYESGAPDRNKPALIMLAIGISHYEKPAWNLGFGHADALAMQQVFESQKTLAKDLFREVKTRLIPETRANRLEILEGLTWLSHEGTQNDIRILFLSGHGGLLGENYYFFSREHDLHGDPEADDVSWNVIMDRLNSARSKVVLFVDTCRAAAVTGEKRRNDKTFSQIIKDLQNQYYGVVTFAASTDQEESAERKEWGHGAFTLALLEGLQGKADHNHVGVVQWQELGAWIGQRVQELTGGNQHAIVSPAPNLPSFALFRVPK